MMSRRSCGDCVFSVCVKWLRYDFQRNQMSNNTGTVYFDSREQLLRPNVTLKGCFAGHKAFVTGAAHFGVQLRTAPVDTRTSMINIWKPLPSATSERPAAQLWNNHSLIRCCVNLCHMTAHCDSGVHVWPCVICCHVKIETEKARKTFENPLEQVLRMTPHETSSLENYCLCTSLLSMETPSNCS